MHPRDDIVKRCTWGRGRTDTILLPLVFETNASTNSATQASDVERQGLPPPLRELAMTTLTPLRRSRVDSNHRRGFCRPQPNRSATRPFWDVRVEP